MRKFLRTMLIALTAIALAAPVVAEAQAAPAPKKEIKDPAEYNSYVGATQQTNPQAKISGLIDFLQRYPNSVVKEDALEHLMTAYQQTGDAAKALETVGRLLEVSPNNLRGLAVMAYNKRQAALAGQDTAKNAADAEDMGQRGLKTLSTAAKPEGMSDPDWDKLKRQYGLVFNAAIGGFGGPLHEMPPEQWDAVLNTNLRGVYYCIRAFAPMMMQARGGHIVNISSLAGKNALPGGAAYAASKWGLNGLTYSVAEELRGHNIRVAVVCPGSVDTELSPHAGKDPGKMLQPDDVAHVVAMLVTQAPQAFASEVLLRPTQKP